MKLEANHLASYLPYGILIYDTSKDVMVNNENNKFIFNNLPAEMQKEFGRNGFEQLLKDETLKIVLKPISEAEKEIAIELKKFHESSFYYTNKIIDLFCRENTGTHNPFAKEKINKLPYKCIEWLFENHYDFYGLIDNDLAINF